LARKNKRVKEKKGGLYRKGKGPSGSFWPREDRQKKKPYGEYLSIGV